MDHWQIRDPQPVGPVKTPAIQSALKEAAEKLADHVDKEALSGRL